MIPTPDFRSIPAFSWERLNIGAKLTGGACFPSTPSQAASWASKLHRGGYRAVGLHHLDIPAQEWGLSLERVAWLLMACARKGIAGFIEFRSQKPWNEQYVSQLCKLPNVVAASPSNEDIDDHFDERSEFVRKHGFGGKLFRSNAGIQGGEFGDLEDCHIYTGYPRIWETGKWFFDCKYPEWSDTLERKSDLDLIVTECGTLYPNPQRYESDVAIYQRCLDLGAKVVMPFALCTNEWDWNSGGKIGRDWFSYGNDPQRMDAVSWLASKLIGKSYIPFTGDAAMRYAPEMIFNTSPTFKVG